MDTIRIGIVGAGGIVKNHHMPGLQAIDGVEIAAVVKGIRQSNDEQIQHHYG
jgi:predicted dehydrogenase